ncbi:hypothetical protein MLD38_008639 [Melastoma candidum]|uniref:Uncharacterized protein n=1 Tax=Melastoma candidum TaxID=119954 RepID=A0ACB9RU39_9MYRT|nr:hypothetical protein MLD38_008639 [Melastoma candidum]
MDKPCGRLRMEPELAVVAAGNPRDEELMAGVGDEVAIRSRGRRGLWLGRGEGNDKSQGTRGGRGGGGGRAGDAAAEGEEAAVGD